jgi:hypothetical protein
MLAVLAPVHRAVKGQNRCADVPTNTGQQSLERLQAWQPAHESKYVRECHCSWLTVVVQRQNLPGSLENFMLFDGIIEHLPKAVIQRRKVRPGFLELWPEQAGADSKKERRGVSQIVGTLHGGGEQAE